MSQSIFLSKFIGHWFYLSITGSQSKSFVLCPAEDFIYIDIWCIRQHVQIVDCILMKIVPYLQYGYYSLSSLTKYVALPFVLVRIQLQLKNDQVTRTRILITEFINKLEFTVNEMSDSCNGLWYVQRASGCWFTFIKLCVCFINLHLSIDK